ncbi:MAG: bifunctional hydroxymethylpyrimidine kinase/phosphomethylpyrimidine kinase [Vulcanimicrobiaceae bacterium]
MNAAVASVGTTHPWNIAGVGLDARVAEEYDVRLVTAVAAVTAQDAQGVHALHAVPSNVLRAQLEALPGGIGAYRIGALGTAQNVREVTRFLRANPSVPAVVDPVFAATLGGSLGDAEAFEALRDELLHESSVVLTPNIDEAARLLGRRVTRDDDLVEVARALLGLGPSAVLLKGGHLDGDPTDVFVSGSELHVYTEPRLPGSMRGSGCALAAALACECAQGRDLRAAVESARAFVRERIAAHIIFEGMQVAF